MARNGDITTEEFLLSSVPLLLLLEAGPLESMLAADPRFWDNSALGLRIDDDVDSISAGNGELEALDEVVGEELCFFSLAMSSLSLALRFHVPLMKVH